MKLMQLPRMMWSSHEGWDELGRERPGIATLFLGLVLPLSLLPPLMLAQAAGGIGARHFPHVAAESWLLAAALFFVVELGTVLLLTALIRAVSQSKGGSTDVRDAFMVAAIAPVPLWLSSLVLLQQDLAVVFVVPVVALVASAGLIRHGVENRLQVGEAVDAAELALIVTNSGVLAWLLLVGIALAPLFLA